MQLEAFILHQISHLSHQQKHTKHKHTFDNRVEFISSQSGVLKVLNGISRQNKRQTAAALPLNAIKHALCSVDRKRNGFNFPSLNNMVIVAERNDYNKVHPHSALKQVCQTHRRSLWSPAMSRADMKVQGDSMWTFLQVSWLGLTSSRTNAWGPSPTTSWLPDGKLPDAGLQRSWRVKGNWPLKAD